MPFELGLVREKIILNNKAGNETSQILIEGDIIVPDIKPDIEHILRVCGNIVIDDVKTEDGRISFKGSINIGVLYQAKKSDKLIHSMTSSIPIDDIMNIEGVTKDSTVNLTTMLEHLENKLINDRKISVKAVITADANIENEAMCDVIKDIDANPAIQTKKGSMKVNNTIENKKDRFVIKEELALSGGKPNIRELLQSDIMICDKEIKVMEGKVWVKGKICMSTLYIGDNDESIIELMEHEVPFNGYIEAKNAMPDMIANVKLNVETQEVHVMPDDDGEDRVFDTEIVVGADMKVMNSEEVEIVEDAYSISKPIEITREKIQYPQFVGKNNTESSVKEVITIDGVYPDMMQVEKVWGTVALDDVELIQDKLVAEGVINLEILYIAKDDKSPVDVITHSVPFKQEIEVKGARDDMSVDVEVEIENISFNMLSEREVEIRVALDFDVFVTKEVNGEIITEMVMSDNGAEMLKPTASVIIYVIQKGDTLWNIAKKYNTTVEDLTILNEIENPDKIYAGQKLLILKKISE